MPETAETPTIRRAPETNWPWRLVEEADLLPGLRVLMIDADRVIDPSTSPWGQWILLDENPVEDREIGGDVVPYVYYHLEARHSSDLQCLTTVATFTATKEPLLGDYPDPRYWLPFDPSHG